MAVWTASNPEDWRRAYGLVGVPYFGRGRRGRPHGEHLMMQDGDAASFALHVGPPLTHISITHPKLPANLRPVVRRATQPERDNRYSNVGEMREAWLAASGQQNTASVVQQINAIVAVMKRTA